MQGAWFVDGMAQALVHWTRLYLLYSSTVEHSHVTHLYMYTSVHEVDFECKALHVHN